jgi:hypothetical protein
MFQGSFPLLCIMDQFTVKAAAALYLILQGLINTTLCPKKPYHNSIQRCTGKIGFEEHEYFKPISRQRRWSIYVGQGFLF